MVCYESDDVCYGAFYVAFATCDFVVGFVFLRHFGLGAVEAVLELGWVDVGLAVEDAAANDVDAGGGDEDAGKKFPGEDLLD